VRTLILIAAATFIATIAQAKSEVLNVTCAIPTQQKISVTFSGHGSVTIDQDGETAARMDLSIQGPGVKHSFTEFYSGLTKRFPKGTYMSNRESYGVDLLAEHVTSTEDGKPMSLHMLLGGPALDASAKIILDGAEYRSNCDIVPSSKD
jgi:hypothetical protein